METILAYLELADPDYQAGVALLAGVNKNRSLVNNLRNKENEQNTRKLRHELARVVGVPALALPPGLVEQLAEVSGLDTEQAGQLIEQATLGDVAPLATPSVTEGRENLTPEAAAEVDGIVELQARLNNQMVQISNTLADLPSDEARANAVEQQDMLEKQYNALADKKRLILERGTLPAEDEAPAADAAPQLDREQLKAKQLSLRSTISKNKGKAAKAKTPETKQNYEQKMAQAQAELNTINLQLAATKDGN